MKEEEVTATLVTYNTQIENHDTSYKNGINNTHLTKDEAQDKAESYNSASWRSESAGEMSFERMERTVYKGTLKPDSIRESNLSDNVIAHYDIHQSGYDAPATVNSMKENELPEEAWFIYHMGGFQIADKFGTIQE